MHLRFYETESRRHDVGVELVPFVVVVAVVAAVGAGALEGGDVVCSGIMVRHRASSVRKNRLGYTVVHHNSQHAHFTATTRRRLDRSLSPRLSFAQMLCCESEFHGSNSLKLKLAHHIRRAWFSQQSLTHERPCH